MDTISIKPYTEDMRDKWDDFVMERSANGTFLQARRFLSYHPEGRFIDDSRMIYRNSELVAVCPAARCGADDAPVFRSHPGSTFGGLVVAPSQQRAPKMVELVSVLTEQLARDGYKTAELKPTSDIFCREPDCAMEYALFKQGYTEEDEIACCLPLQKDYQSIRDAYSYNKRYDLKRAEAHSLSDMPIDTEDGIREFYALLCKNLLKFDAKPVHTAEELIDFHNARLKDEISFLGVRDEGARLVAGACLFYFRQTNVLHTQYLATDTDIRAYVPSTYLYDAVIREAIRRKCAALSLGTSTHEHGHVLNTGLIQNKEGYGASHSLNRIFTISLA